MQDNILELVNINKSFDGEQILKNLNLSVGRNEFVTLLGPSGCGKTTTLRIIGGFQYQDSGELYLDGKEISGVKPEKREMNTVFQKYALFPHMNVEENIAFGLRVKKQSREYIRDKVRYALKLVNLEGYEKRKPYSLSGGQQQRIAIARAIVNEPKLLLLDEPLGALDLKLRQDMQRELIRLKNELGITFIYVTHDQEEALTMSDKIVVMNQGIIQQTGTPQDIYNKPQNAFVADFIGKANLLSGTMLHERLVEINGVRFACADGGFGDHTPVDVVIRPENVVLNQAGMGLFDGVITSVLFKGVHYEITVEAIGITWLIHTTQPYPVGERRSLFVDPNNIQIMNKPVSEDERVTAEEGRREV